MAPVPKRSSQRHGHRKQPETDKAPKVGGTYRVPAARSEWHPGAKELWNALKKSDQTYFYQPSDWAYAHSWIGLFSDQLFSEKPSAMMLAAFDSAMSRLLVTEGDRRRARIELEKSRGDTEETERQAGVASMKAFRAKLSGGA